MSWVESAGGPLLLIPASLLHGWEGGNGSGRAATDYDRACDVEGYVGVIPVGEGQGLVLGDMPMPVAWWPDSGGILVRWMAADSEGAVIELLKALPDSLGWETEVSIELTSDEELILFDAAYPGNELPSKVGLIPARRGLYAVETAIVEKEDISLVLHRFKAL